jgi:Tfp pilus assembly protein PilF
VRLAVFPIAVEGAPVPAADGLGVELAERLSGARRGFVVIPPAEAQRNSVNTLEKAKTAMAATHVLRTRVRSSGSRLAVEASVIATNSNLTLQELRGSYGPNDIALVAKALTATITSAFRLRARVPMEVLAAAAYPSYVQGLNLLRRDDASADEAMPFFRKASEQDPRSALPYAGLAEAYLQKFQRRFGTDWMDRATQAVMRAQSLNTDSAPVLLAAGHLKQLHGWYDQAAQDYARAAELAPGSADAWNRLALAYSAMNRPDQAITTYRKALEAQPDYYLPYIDFGRFYRKQLQFREAEQLFRHVTVIVPGPRPKPYAVGNFAATTESPVGGGAGLPYILTGARDRSCADRSRCSVLSGRALRQSGALFHKKPSA